MPSVAFSTDLIPLGGAAMVNERIAIKDIRM
jgi:hypothetical protein